MLTRSDREATYRTFDFPSPDISAPQRPTTTVPQQALFLLNSPFLLDQARPPAHTPPLPTRPALASAPPDERIARLHRDLFGRPPEPREIDLARRFVESRPRAE